MKVLVKLEGAAIFFQNRLSLFEQIPGGILEGKDMILRYIASSILKYSRLVNTEAQPLIVG